MKNLAALMTVAFISVAAAVLDVREAEGQQAPTVTTGSSPSPASAPLEDTRYRIGPGDVLAIIVRKAPELSMEAVRVDQQGMIHIPMIKGQITAACRTENELAKEIEDLYREYKTDPSVAIFVREYQSRPVSVIGAVNSPNQFRLQRRVRLLEMLTFAGGPSGAAGRVVNVIHASGTDICEAGSANGAGEAESLSVFRLTDTLKGKVEANPFVAPGDVVQVPQADQVFVVGHVFSPRAIPLQDKTITVSRAIAMAGGPQRDSKTGRIRIVRQADGDAKQVIFVDLKAIEDHNAVDVALLPNDIVEVPSSTGKVILSTLQGAIVPIATQAPIRAIP
jgi:polysaccharide export outer membrane protein